MPEKIHRINKFQGLHDYADSSANEGYTRDLKNVFVRYNRIWGRPGMQVLETGTDASNTPIRHLSRYYATYMRVTPTRVEKMVPGAGSWTDITGSITLGGSSTMIPESVTHKETWVMVNEAYSPVKWAGTGNIADLGGDPPYARSIAQNWGYLFLFVTSDTGSIWDLYEGVYSDDFDNDWSGCGGNELRFDETEGYVITGSDVGDNILVYKTDDIIRVRFIGGQLRFSQKRLRYSNGIGAKASIAKVGVAGHCFLNGNFQLAFCDGEAVTELPAKFQHHLDRVMYQPFAYQCVGVGSGRHNTYNLFYPTSASDSFLRGRLVINVLTGEFTDLTYDGHAFSHAMYYQNNENDLTDQILIAANTTDVHILDDESQTNDVSTGVVRYYAVDWTDCGEPGDKYLTGVALNFRRKVGGRIAVSVAVNGRARYFHRKFLDLKGVNSGGDFVKALYKPEAPLLGETFKVKIEFFHDRANTFTELVPPIDIIYEPTGEYQLQGDSNSSTKVS